MSVSVYFKRFLAAKSPFNKLLTYPFVIRRNLSLFHEKTILLKNTEISPSYGQIGVILRAARILRAAL